MCFAKHLVRYGVIAGLVGGTAALVAGPERIHALFTQTQQSINASIDRHIEDPVALRSQMKALEGQYPERIAEVRGDLAELREQMAQLKREQSVSERVVALASNDFDQMQDLLGKAQTTQASVSLASDGPAKAHIIRVVFNGESLDLKDAYAKATKIQQVRNAYSNRMTEIQRDLGYLSQQESRLTQLAQQLDTEHQDFQAQMWQMDRQVDSIARNDRLIAMMEKRQRTLDEQGRYKANSLEQLSSRFADIRAKQESKLETLGQSSSAVNYEDRAKFDLDSRKAYGTTETATPAPSTPGIIEITPDTQVGPMAPANIDRPAALKPVAMRFKH
jgi:predicted RNase H-like nuclease (RuvC/YqgF family)